MDYEKIRQDKIQEANDFYKMIGIKTYDENLPDIDQYPIFSEFSKELNPEKEIEFHWTRLSINSNIGCTTE